MRNLIYTLVITVAVLSGCASKYKNTEASLIVEAEILGVPDSVMIFLQINEDESLRTIDSAYLIRSKARLAGTISPQLAYVNIGGTRKAINFFAEPTNIKIRTHIDSLQATRVSGSAAHDDLLEFMAVMHPIDIRSEEINEEYGEASMNGDTQKMKELAEEYKNLQLEHTQQIHQFLNEKKSSFIAPFIIREYLIYELEYAQIDSLMKALDPSLAASDDYQFLAKHAEILRKVSVGQPAIDFALNDPNGNPVAVSSFRGKYLLIDFWAAWCGPCRRENPNLVKLYQDFSPMGFEILGVSFDRNRSQWLNAIETDNLTWPQVSDLNYMDSEAARLYGIIAIPSSVLLDRKGVIIAKNLKSDDLRKKLEELRATEDQNI